MHRQSGHCIASLCTCCPCLLPLDTRCVASVRSRALTSGPLLVLLHRADGTLGTTSVRVKVESTEASSTGLGPDEDMLAYGEGELPPPPGYVYEGAEEEAGAAAAVADKWQRVIGIKATGEALCVCVSIGLTEHTDRGAPVSGSQIRSGQGRRTEAERIQAGRAKLGWEETCVCVCVCVCVCACVRPRHVRGASCSGYHHTHARVYHVVHEACQGLKGVIVVCACVCVCVCVCHVSAGWSFRKKGKLVSHWKAGLVTILGAPYSEHSSYNELCSCVRYGVRLLTSLGYASVQTSADMYRQVRVCVCVCACVIAGCCVPRALCPQSTQPPLQRLRLWWSDLCT